MRFIDNMTPQELDTLAIKGMTAPRTAGERKNDPSLNWAMYNPDKANPRTIQAEKPTAQPWFILAQPKPDELHPMVSIWAGSETRESIVCNSCSPADAKLIVASVNHADALAEALRAVRDAYQQMFDVMPVAWQTYDHIVTEALAAYESEVRQ